MEFMAKSSIINISPRKVKAVVDKIKGKSLDQSLILLGLWSKKSAGTLRGTLLSAAANAKEKAGLKKEELKIKSIQVLSGASFKRMRARAKGQGDTIKRKTSRIRVVVKDQKEDR